MFFKSLEIFGFKSFANKTRLEFHPGVTAVVGPNGCGKSNISDSIKWVLGEQSAKSLRGSKMEDVIFNGADAQEPVNFAQVSITLDNTERSLPVDYDEVVISRKLYRSGESVYLLNGSPIRLKDVHSILAGTGMGVGNYSFIEQGKIDSILSAKPEDRRTLFEEAAGITKFKIKKKETLRNLEACESNLQRANDIINELSKQIASLERQAKKAEKYKKDFERLKLYDLTSAIKTTQELLDSKSALSESVDEVTAQRSENTAQLELLSENYTEAKEILQEVEAVYSEFKSEQAVIDGSMKSTEEKVEIFTRYIEELRLKISDTKEQIEVSGERLIVARDQITQLEELWSKVSTEQQFAQENIDKAQGLQDEKTYQLSAMQENIRVAESKFQEVISHIQQSHLKKTEIQSSRVALTDRVLELNQAAESLQQEIKILSVDFDKNQQIEGDLSQKIRAKVLEREKVEQAVLEAQQKLKSLDNQSSQLVSEISAEQSKLGVLEELAQRHEGYSKGAKYLLELKRQGDISTEVVGALADLVEVEPGYEMALEAALDSLAQSIVCEDLDSAKKIAQTLNQEGRAILFYPSAHNSHEDRLPAPSHLKRLMDFTRSGSVISKTYQEFIKRYYIVNDLDEAFELSAEYRDLIFVTKGGEICRNNVVVAGKLEAGEAGHLFGRESRIQSLKARIAELKIELGQLKSSEAEAVSRIEGLQSSLKNYTEEIPSLQVAYAEAVNQKTSLEKRLSELSESKSEKNSVAHALSEKAEQLTIELATLDEHLIDYSAAVEALKLEIADLKSKKESCMIEREEILVKITTLKSNQETVAQRASQVDRELNNSKANLGDLERLITSKSSELTTLEQKMTDTSEQVQGLVDQFEKLQADKASMSSRFEEIMTDRSTKAERLNEIEQQRNQNQQMSAQLQTQLHEMQMKLQNVGHEMKLVAEKINTTYGLQLSDAENHLVPTDEENGAPETWDPLEIETIRERIAKSGGVNLIAVEEYEELKKRYDFLEKERQDLINAKDDIHKALQKINRQTREMFLTTFEQIQTHFVEYYKLLFGGGNAEIILLDRNDVLESGIEIVARPPGKKLQSISLLSGGEKALTAIALMFSVFRVKPSPFCVLDEIDAPLDDTNVGRFSTVLQEFIRESQFIIITHNKVTMEVADAMYGVTMQKTGISRVVSVRFDDKTKPSLETSDAAQTADMEISSPTIEI